MIHHSNVTCDECGERHSPDHPIECRDGLKRQLAECWAELDGVSGQRDRLIAANKMAIEQRDAAVRQKDIAARLLATERKERDRLREACRTTHVALSQYDLCSKSHEVRIAATELQEVIMRNLKAALESKP